MRKYLNDIGIKEDETCIPNSADTSDERMPRFLEQREKYGFDERETWSLEFTFACWLYEHLMMYLEIADNTINLSFHKFKIPVIQEQNKEFDYETVKDNIKYEETTQKECIELCIDYLKKYFETNREMDERSDAYLRIAIEIFSIISPAMWW